MELYPGGEFVKPEFVQSCVELTSPVSDTSDDAVRHIGQTLSKVLRRCEELDMTACGAGTHPFCRRLALITPTPRYRRMEESHGILAHTQITFSTHVHVGMPSGDDAMRAMSRLIPALPAFIALSANSPFWRGHETGHAAYRHRILAAAPTYGLPTSFSCWADFERFHHAAISSGTIEHFKDIHWDIRPHPDFGTIEIRVMDAAADLQNVHALAAFARALAVCMVRTTDGEVRRILPAKLPLWVERENHFRAGHTGIDADYIYNDEGRHRPIRGLIDDLISLCDPIAEEIGESEGLELVRKILGGRTGYSAQLDVFSATDSMQAVTADLVQRLRHRQTITMAAGCRSGAGAISSTTRI
jgi:carboxylate-amine ligase